MDFIFILCFVIAVIYLFVICFFNNKSAKTLMILGIEFTLTGIGIGVISNNPMLDNNDSFFLIIFSSIFLLLGIITAFYGLRKEDK